MKSKNQLSMNKHSETRPHLNYGKFEYLLICLKIDENSRIFNYVTTESRNMNHNNVKSSNSMTNYEPSFKSRVASVRSRDQRKVSTEQQRLYMIKNKYSAYRSNISNLDDKRFVIPSKSKARQRQNRMIKASSKPRRKKECTRSNRNSELNQPSQPEWVNELSSLGNLISATQSLDTNNVEQKPQIVELKKIADNADNLIRILNSLKDTMGNTGPEQTQNKVESK